MKDQKVYKFVRFCVTSKYEPTQKENIRLLIAELRLKLIENAPNEGKKFRKNLRLDNEIN